MSHDACPLAFVRGVPVVAAPGFIDISNAEIVDAAFRRAACWGYGTIAADMSATQCCDSVGLTMLARVHNRAKEEGGQLRLAAVTAPVRRLLSRSGLDRLLCVFRTVAEAVDELPVIAIARPRREHDRDSYDIRGMVLALPEYSPCTPARDPCS